MARKEDVLHPPKIEWMVEPRYNDFGEQVSAGIDIHGKEHGDPVPTAPPVGMSVSRGDELHTAIRRLVHAEMFRQAVDQEGFESFEDAEDFDVEDGDLDPHTPYEAVFDPPAPSPQGPLPGATPASPSASGDVGRGSGGARPEPAPPDPANPQPQPIPDGPPPRGVEPMKVT